MPKWGKGKRKRKSERDKFMIGPELARFMVAAKVYSLRWYHIFGFQANLGLRITEALRLRKSDFTRIDEGVVAIPTLKQKTDVADDVVYVDSATQEWMKKYLNTLPASQKYLFTNGERPPNRVSAWSAFNAIIEKAGLNKAYSPHSLRHSRGVALWEGSHDIEYVKRQLRHRSISNTQIYMHMSPEAQKAMTEKVKPVF